MKKVLCRWSPPVTWMGLIFFFSAQPDIPRAPGPWLDALLKKTGHALAYGILAWLYLRALRWRRQPSVHLRVVSLGLALLYAASDEYHQTFVPGRNGTLWDVALDGAGACGAMLLDWQLRRRRASSRREFGAQ